MSEPSYPLPRAGYVELASNTAGSHEMGRGQDVYNIHDHRGTYYEEEEWTLDDAQHLRGAYRQPSSDQRLGSAATGSLGHALPIAPASLPYPVILPQRRPGQRDRGFIRAYAPDLMRCGIDLYTFMNFLDDFDKAIATSPWVGTVNLAAGVAGVATVAQLIPAYVSPISLAVRITAGVYKEMQGRKNQNAFILKMNDELFRPRGLYCLILAYNPSSQESLVQQDLNSNAYRKASEHSEYRSNDGTTGPIEFPTSAELIFPGLDDQVGNDQEDENSSRDGFSKAFDAFNDHRDLKAQRKYLRKNPASALNPLMDPKVELRPKDLKKQERRLEKDERKHEKEERKREKRARKHPERPEKGPRKRLLRKDILYMMIVNMPSQKEMEDALKLVGNNP